MTAVPKKRIAVLVSNPCTSDARVIKMVEVARAAGYEVHVFATTGANAKPWEVVDGVTYHRLDWKPSQMLARRGLLGLFVRIARTPVTLFAKTLVPYVKYGLFREVFEASVVAVRPDLIHAHDLITLPAAVAVADIVGAKVVYDAHELEVHRNPPLPLHMKWWVGRVERKYARRAHAVNTVGRKVGEVLAKHIGRKDVNIVYNAPLLEASPANVRVDLQLRPEQPLILYVGKVTIGRGVGDILELLPGLPGVFFATVGPSDPATRRLLLQRALALGVGGRFRTLPPVPHEQVTSYITGADLGLISVEPVTLSYRYCMPNKLFELSFANVPILSNVLDEIVEFLQEHGNGEAIDFENKRELSYVIYRMVSDNQRYRMDDERRERLALDYSWATQAQKILRIYAGALG